MDKFDYALIGILNSARFLAYNLDQPSYARDLIQHEVLDSNMSTLKNCKNLAKIEGIELSKLWNENFK